MPIFEYRCDACGKEFEKLVRQSDPAPACPSCRATALTRKLSTFAALAGTPSFADAAPGGCGSCGDPRGPGACQLG